MMGADGRGGTAVSGARVGWGRLLGVLAAAMLVFGCGEAPTAMVADRPDSDGIDDGSGEQAEPDGPLGPAEVMTFAEGHVDDPILAVDHQSGTVYLVWTAREPEHDHGDHDAHQDHDAHHDHDDHTHGGHDHQAHGDEHPPQIHLAVSDDGGRSFSDPIRVDGPDPVEGFSAFPRSDLPTQVVVTPDGAVHVVYAVARPIEGQPRPAVDLRIATSRDGGATFGEPRQLVASEDAEVWSPSFHRTIVAPDGALHVAFLATPAGGGSDGRSVRVVTSWDGGETFDGGETVATSTCQCCPVSMTARDDGRIGLAWRHIFWQEDGSPHRDIAVAFSHDDGESWGELAAVHEDGWLMEGCPHTGPALASGPDGRMHVAWYTGREGDPGLRYTSEQNEERFGDPAILATDEFFPVTQPSIDVAGDGTAWVTWDDQRDDESTVWLARISPAGDVHIDDEPFASGRDPRVAVAGDEVLVTWRSEAGLEIAVVAGSHPS